MPAGLNSPAGTSALALRVRVPKSAATTATTTSTVSSGSIIVSVFGSANQFLQSTTLSASSGPQTATFTNIPLGPVSVQVQFLNGNNALLADGSGSTTITPGSNSLTVSLAFRTQLFYATNTVAQTVAGFRFDPVAGTATPVGTPVPVTGAVTLVADRTGHFLYVPDTADSEIRVLSINQATGALTPEPQLTVGIPASFSIFPVVTPDNQFLYLAGTANTTAGAGNSAGIPGGGGAGTEDLGVVSGFAINPQTGALTPIPGGPYTIAGQGEFDASLDSSGRFLNVTTTGLNGGVVDQLATQFAIQPDGSLQRVAQSGLPELKGSAPTSLANAQVEWGSAVFNPKNDIAYIMSSNPFTSQVVAAPVQSNGALGTPLTPTPVVGVGTTNTAAIDPNGNFLYSCDVANNTIDLYPLAADGTPQATTSSFATDVSPGVLTFDPTGQFAMVACRGTGPNFTDGAIDIFSHNNATGALTRLATLPSPGRPDQVAFAPIGIMPTPPPTPAPPTLATGALRYIGSGPANEDVVITPNGRFLYISTAGSVKGFAINTDGTLNLTPVANLPDNNFVYGLAMDPQGQFLYSSDVVALHAFAIGSDGSLTEMAGSPVSATGGGLVTTDATGTFVYETTPLVPNGGGIGFTSTTSYAAYQVNRANSSIAAVTPAPFGGLFVLADSPSTGLLAATAFNVTPAALEIQSLSNPAAPSLVFSTNFNAPGGGLSFTPDGQFLYATSESATVQGFSVAANGQLTPLAQGAVATGRVPQWLAIDPTGRFMAVTNNTDGTVDMFKIGTGGTLTAVPGSPFLSAGIPGFAVFDATGTHLYVSCAGSGVLSIYSVGQ